MCSSQILCQSINQVVQRFEAYYKIISNIIMPKHIALMYVNYNWAKPFTIKSIKNNFHFIELNLVIYSV